MRRPAVLAGLLAGLLIAGTAPARAEGELLVSADGTSWSETVTQPLFDPSARWVPGDQRDTVFWVRNTTGDTGRIELSFTSEDVDALLDGGGLTLQARTSGGAWQPLLAEGALHVVATAIPGPSTTQVLVRATLATTAPNATMADVAHLDFTTRLTSVDTPPGSTPDEPTAPTPTSPAEPAEPGDDGVRLPATGAMIPGWLVVVALAMVGAGIALIGGGRARHG